MSETGKKGLPILQKFLSPNEPKVAFTDKLNQEYFKKIAHSKGRRLSSYPGVAISEGRILQTYGTTGPEDVTDRFYAGPETVYCISPVPSASSPSKAAPEKIALKIQRRNPERIVRRGNGKSLDLDNVLDCSAVDRKEEEHISQSRRLSVSSVKDRQLGQTPSRSLTSAGTDISTDREILKEMRVSLKTNINEPNKELPSAWLSSGDWTPPSISNNEEQTSSKEDANLYMANVNKGRQVSKGELKKKRIGKTLPTGTSTKTLKPIFASNDTVPMTLAISGKVPEAKADKNVSSYQIRQKYADDIERNWFVELMQKAKTKKTDREWLKRRFDLRPDMFYSPEPGEESSQSEYETEIHDHGGMPEENDTSEDIELEKSFNTGQKAFFQLNSRQNSIPTPNVSVKDGKPTETNRVSHPKRRWLRHFDSTDVLVGNTGELEESSMSDIETVLQNGVIQERRCKHKMYKKRQRQKKRYEPFIQVPPVSDNNEDSSGHAEETMPMANNISVKHLRGLRLKAKKRKDSTLRGLSRFKQVVNAIIVYVHFKKRLRKLRKNSRKRKTRSRKSKKVKWNNELEIYTRFERQTSPVKEPIHEKFMREIGLKLLDDMAKLSISLKAEDEDVRDTEEMTPDGTQATSFYKEIQRVSLDDVSVLLKNKKCFRRERRLSEPCAQRPDYISFMVSEKSVSKRSPGKSRRQSKSPSKVKSKSELLGKSPSLLPPIITPYTVGTTARKSPVPSHKHSHEQSNTCREKEKNKPRRRSSSATKRRRSKSPITEVKANTGKIIKEVKIWPEVYRPRSYSASQVRFKSEISVRELLKDADIPAKEIAIQIIERKRKRNRRRMADAAIRKESRDIEKRRLAEIAERERELQAELEREEEERRLAKERMSRSYVSPFVSSGVAWHQKKTRPYPTWTNQELDVEIAKLSGLFFEMRNCSYIRWSNKDQAILRRLAELESITV